MASEKIIVEGGEMWFREDGILHFVMSSKVHFDMPHAIEAAKTMHELTKGIPCLHLHNISQSPGSSKEARDFFNDPTHEYPLAKITKACAVIADNGTVASIVGKIITQKEAPPFPSKMFDNEQDALAWLKTYLYSFTLYYTYMLLFYLGLSFIIMHEMDAIRCKEWQIFPLTFFLNDKWGYITFMFAHIPLFVGVFYAVNQPNNASFIFWFNWFLIAHLLAHLIFLLRPKNEFKDWISWIIIIGAALFGGLDLLY